MSKSKFTKIIVVICIAAMFITGTSILSFAEDGTVQQSNVQIVRFDADSYNITPNQSVTISWKVLNADKVEITNMAGQGLSHEGSLEVWLMETTTFTLKAYDANGEVTSRSITVNLEHLEIKKFTVSRNEISAGETVELSWDVSGATDVSIPELTEKDLPTFESIQIQPLKTTTYTLTAYGLDGGVVKGEVTVKVNEPEITDFSADKYELDPGDSATLSWNAPGFQTIKIVGLEDEGHLPLTGTLKVSPQQTTTYTLEATTYDGIVKSKQITVKVKKPVITSFTVDKPSITKGEMFKLSWTSEYADHCYLTTNYGNKLLNRQPNGGITVASSRDITFELTAVDKYGNEVKSKIEIKVSTGVN
ncbi:hypothetical protein [Ruminiclostridium cellulolyticum]|uniref:Uncharacterized protein Ccel_3195 n=1 Tax=Ruminiclostridium cellulolyticum (strain ATCC 35319 / DSM 5812 / JCM 6584 / H10) TaxID=394503 RepID=Y3195_RUMCH|nr:hypothetical protein [Ruminiclostridium cellulolyticum]B8I0F9.1 RecName: Full=Uncharacterized protein Ccel_3195; Flags: Precursor [Ruminiclostridium cellulolyticum H10]ACL77485.1 OmpA/MotB domain-containing protein [Ruminiclostridium cellulolyticum H10]